MSANGVFAGPLAGLLIDLALILAGSIIYGLPHLGLLGGPIQSWFRRRRESGEARMLRGHAEWVRRIGHITFDVARPPQPRRAPNRPATWRPAPLFAPGPPAPIPAATPRSEPRRSATIVPFPDRRT